jgi:uncharacterized damage-inducible protein DinB
MPSKQERHAMIDAIRTLPDQVIALVDGLDEHQLTAHPIPGEWSIAQNVHHLVDSHINSYVRCKLMATEERPTFRPYDEAAWAELPDASSAGLSYSLAMLHDLHARWALFWEALTDEQWRRSGYHPADDVTVTLEQQLQLYVEHGRAHLAQIERALAAI